MSDPARDVSDRARAAETTDLVASVRAGDRATLTRIFREYYVGLCEFAERYVRSAELAEELVQDVFAAIWANRAGWVVRGTIRSYLYGAVRNRALRSTARAAMARRWTDAAARHAADARPAAAAADAMYEEREIAAAVARVLEALPPRRREAYLLRRDHGLSTAEAATAMGVSAKAIEMHVSRALAAIRAALAKML